MTDLTKSIDVLRMKYYQVSNIKMVLTSKKLHLKMILCLSKLYIVEVNKMILYSSKQNDSVRKKRTYEAEGNPQVHQLL